MKILGALYLLKTLDLIFKRGEGGVGGCQRTWASNPSILVWGFCQGTGL
jgi:hypothetical protein